MKQGSKDFVDKCSIWKEDLTTTDVSTQQKGRESSTVMVQDLSYPTLSNAQNNQAEGNGGAEAHLTQALSPVCTEPSTLRAKPASP